jgi:hypothetical protein
MKQSKVFTPAVGKDVKFENASDWGKFFHRVTLKDGRDIGFSADKVAVTDNGDLIAISNSHYNSETKKYDPLETPKTIVALAKGEWICFYSASVLTGDPIGIDWFESTEPAAR